MCGRFTLRNSDLRSLISLFNAQIDEEFSCSPRYNIGPSSWHPIFCSDSKRIILKPAFWGFEGHNSSLLINARLETAACKPTFSKAFKSQRCIIPADGFFEWKKENGVKRPYYFHFPDNKVFLLAGLFQRSKDNKLCFVILTVPANSIVQSIHDRMPLIFSCQDAIKWLKFSNITSEWRKESEQLTFFPVSLIVNNIRNDDPRCVQPFYHNNKTF